ncbi:MAG: amidohydrolase [Chloroflexi bacterium]|nr:amidohydrolase [Chloroflexota bacterium]
MFIDLHMHTTRISGVRRTNGSTFATPEELIAMMDRLGIAKGMLLPLVSPECGICYTTTEEMLAVAHDYPGRFIPFCNVDPRIDGNSAKTDLHRYLDYYSAAGCKGLGEVTCNLPFDDPRVLNLFAACQACMLTVTIHIAPEQGGYYGLVDAPGLPGLENTLKRFPGCKILGHSQPFWAEMSTDYGPVGRNGYPKGKVLPGGRLPQLFERYPNLYGDLSAGSGYNAISRDPEFGYAFLEQYRERLLFALDICAPTDDTPLVRHLNAAVEQGKISRQTFEMIAWRNAANLYGISV